MPLVVWLLVGVPVPVELDVGVPEDDWVVDGVSCEVGDVLWVGERGASGLRLALGLAVGV